MQLSGFVVEVLQADELEGLVEGFLARSVDVLEVDIIDVVLEVGDNVTA